MPPNRTKRVQPRRTGCQAQRAGAILPPVSLPRCCTGRQHARGLCSRASQLCYSHGAHAQFKRDRLRNTPVGGRGRGRRGRSRFRASAGGPAADHALLPGPPRPSAAGLSVPAGSAVPSCVLQPAARARAQQRAPPAVPGRAAARGGRRAAVRAVRERLCGAGLRCAGARRGARGGDARPAVRPVPRSDTPERFAQPSHPPRRR
jgi:hypothetical protein